MTALCGDWDKASRLVALLQIGFKCHQGGERAVGIGTFTFARGRGAELLRSAPTAITIRPAVAIAARGPVAVPAWATVAKFAVASGLAVTIAAWAVAITELSLA